MVHVLKVYFKDSKNEDQIRRMAVSSDVVNKFELLMEKVCSLLQLPESTNIQIKWKDPEEDLILMSSDDELAQALANAEDCFLRLYVAQKNDRRKLFASNGNCGPVHPLVVCDCCDKKISGVRYKCLQCKDFDLCSLCNGANEHAHHDMIKLVKPIMIARQWVFTGARQMWKSMFGHPSAVFTWDFFEKNSSNSSNDCPTQPKENFPEEEDKKSPNGSDNCKKIFSNSYTWKNDTSPGCADSTEPKDDKEAKQNNSRHTAGQHANPWPPCPGWPGTFMGLLKGDIPPPQSLFEDTCKILNDGLGNIFKNVQGKVEVKVDSPLFKSDFKMGQTTHGTNKDKNEERYTDQCSTNMATESDAETSILKEKCQAGTAGVNSGTTHAHDITPDGVSKTDEVRKEAVPSHPLPHQVPSSGVNHSDSVVEGFSELLRDKDILCETATVALSTSNTTEAESGTCAEDWTFLNEEETKLTEASTTKSTEKGGEKPIYPKLKEPEDDQVKPFALTDDPIIISALRTMQTMGFTNDGGWLERLLISKQGNIHEALDALYPLASNNCQ